MSEQATALSLTANWTNSDLSPTLTNSSNVAVFGNASCGHVWNGYWYPYYQPLVWQDHRPIRLTMAEVERLRVAAKKDKQLKETLEKFTDHIEVVVDFGTEK